MKQDSECGLMYACSSKAVLKRMSLAKTSCRICTNISTVLKQHERCVGSKRCLAFSMTLLGFISDDYHKYL